MQTFPTLCVILIQYSNYHNLNLNHFPEDHSRIWDKLPIAIYLYINTLWEFSPIFPQISMSDRKSFCTAFILPTRSRTQFLSPWAWYGIKNKGLRKNMCHKCCYTFMADNKLTPSTIRSLESTLEGILYSSQVFRQQQAY